MSKTKHAKPDEFQKEQIRHLKKEIRRKDQIIRSLEKELGYTQNKTEKTRKVKEPQNVCPDCQKAVLQESEIVGRRFLICYLCKFRKKV